MSIFGTKTRTAAVFPLIAMILAACSSETRSLVSSADIPVAKYNQVALFIEHIDSSLRTDAEEAAVSAFRNAGIQVVDGNRFLSEQSVSTEKAKASVVQKQFDAVLYITILQSGKTEVQKQGAHFDGQAIRFQDNPLIAVCGEALQDYIIKPDGSVYRSLLALKTKAELQDTKSAKLVWTSETVGYDAFSNVTSRLFRHAVDQIIEKMRSDKAI